ncbi:MAG: dihydropteroate synthase [Bacteroidaceae bacterium]|nr:dihydropteroate synthase [Bacteroidaceae bacterium]
MLININGRLLDLATPRTMGIINVTPDSFYAESRMAGEDEVAEKVRQMITDGADIIDVGAYSSRPGADEVSAKEEMKRLRLGLEAITKAVPEAALSVDTFRADVAKMCVEEYGVAIVNDISGGQFDPQMFHTVAALHVPYILMHMQGTPQTMQDEPHYDDLMETLILYFSERVNRLHDMGVNDIIIDPGFGFAKTLDHNYQLMAHLEELHELQCPLLVGVSRKSMIYRLLGTTPQEALNGTTALNMLALIHGANILRVHDVRQCVETIKIYNKYKQYDNDRH